MRYRVNAMTSDGCAVGVIVETPQAVLATVQAYRADGFEAVSVHDQDGETVQINNLEEEASGSTQGTSAVDSRAN
jgi:hypothetical protein